MKVAITLVTAAAAVGCSPHADRPRSRAQVESNAKARIEQSITLPAGEGTLHVVSMPTGYLEAARCLVVTSPAGGPAVSCASNNLDTSQDER